VKNKGGGGSSDFLRAGLGVTGGQQSVPSVDPAGLLLGTEFARRKGRGREGRRNRKRELSSEKDTEGESRVIEAIVPTRGLITKGGEGTGGRPVQLAPRGALEKKREKINLKISA